MNDLHNPFFSVLVRIYVGDERVDLWLCK